MRTYIWGSGRTRGRHQGAQLLAPALPGVGFVSELDPRVPRPPLLPFCTIVFSVRGLGLVSFVCGGAGSKSQPGS
jgi:hypothetical protein